jgi:hypothetical protein
MGDHHDGLAELVDRAAQEAEQLGAGAGVEVAGGLVGEDDRRPAGKGAGGGEELLLPAGQLPRPVPEAFAQPDRFDDAADPGVVWDAPGDRQRQGDVLRGGQGWQQVVGLEDEPDPVAAEVG